MPWAGGTFTRTNGTYSGSTVWQSDAAATVKIRADRHDTHDQDIGQGINNCLTKDGQNSPVQNISWGGFKITSLGNGSAATDAAAYGQTITALAWSSGTLTATRAVGNLTAVLDGASVNAALGYTPLSTGGGTVTGFFGVATSSATIQIQDTSSIAAGNGGFLDLMAGNNSGTQVALARLKGYLTDGSVGAEAGELRLFTRNGGSVGLALTIDASKNVTVVGAVTVGGGRKLSKITLSTSAPGTLADGELYLRY